MIETNEQTALNTKVLNYLNSSTQNIDEKLYLAKVMQMQYGGLEFSKTEILNNIQNNITKELVKDIYKGSSVSLFQTTDINNTDDIIIASDENEIITTTDEDTKVLLKKGTDKLISGKSKKSMKIYIVNQLKYNLNKNMKKVA